MMKIKKLISILLLFTFSSVQATPIKAVDKYIQGHPQPKANFDKYIDLTELLQSNAKEFSLFYEGPEDTGDASDAADEFKGITDKRLARANAFASQLLKKSPEEVNVVLNTIMLRYLKDPKSRPALKDLIETFSGLEFNNVREEEKAIEKSARVDAAKGFAGGTLIATFVCFFRPRYCDDLTKQIKRNKEVAERAARSGEAKKLVSTEKSADDIIAEVHRRYAIVDNNSKSILVSVGQAASKESFYKRYLKYDVKTKVSQLLLASGIGLVSGVTYAASKKVIQAQKEKKGKGTYLNPQELERMYFGSLAVFELTCQARSQLNNSKVSSAELRNFILNAHQEVQLLGRISGGKRVINKTHLPFVKPIPEKDQYIAVISMGKLVTIRGGCPNIRDMGPNISSSLRELESLLTELIDKEKRLRRAKK